ncbi:TRAP dicarboxylate transporter- DctP subunit [Magnetococcus marinus MC-1]|uniref:TRAP dicarboxylate transporter-DctP subunit n=1 Tax=Magnetococcus marinus (strain ATCC BAA-1437 / JCM 17883 / MC-1) TaxID=156889 RepID=A0LAP9_MAGMM|nr:TRAP transporter substrate-binding protein DctP [Magnetococcus marinus]ABK45042.1 TRAP dicarboxylate transporter- DctP subunit [Magnetococcus marinus MC-1]
MFWRACLFVVTLMFCWQGVVFSAFAAEQKLYLAHLNPNQSDNPSGAMALAFERALAKLSKGGLAVETFPEGQLGKAKQLLDLVQQGVIQSAIVSLDGLADRYPLIGILNYPFRFQNLEETYSVFDGPFGKALGDDILQKTGLQVLGYGDTGGLFVLTNSRRPIRAPGDMAGLRMRTMNLESHMAFMRSLGADPVAVAWGELLSLLKNGSLDGQMNPATIIRVGKLERAQRYLTVTNHLYTPYVWVVNHPFMQSLHAAQADAVNKAAQMGVTASRALAMKDDSLTELAEKMQVYYPTSEQLQAFRDRAQPAMEQFLEKQYGEQGAKLLQLFRQESP